MRVRLANFVLCFTLLFAAANAVAHEGHDHGNDAPQVSAALPRGSASSDHFELVAILRGRTLAIYVDRFATNEPIETAKVEVETPEGPKEAPIEDGVYRLAAPWMEKGGHFDLIVTVSAGDDIEVLPVTIDVPGPQTGSVSGGGRSWFGAFGVHTLLLLGLFTIVALALVRRRSAAAAIVLLAAGAVSGADPVGAHEGHDHKDESTTSATMRDAPQRQPDGSVFVPKTSQRLLAIRTAVTERREYFKSIELPGRIITDPNASGYVQSALAGRLSPPPKGFPRLGTRVEKGDVLAYVTPPIQAIDVSDMRQKEEEILQQLSIVERRVARYEQLIKTEAVARAQLDDARLELKGLQERKAALAESRREPEELVAPVSGVIAAANTVAGQLAQPDKVIFQIVDSSKLWVEALTFEPVAPEAASSASVSNGRSVRLGYRGAGLAGRNQAIPVHFAIDGPTDGLWAGQFVTVYASADERHEGIAVPRAAVVRASNGMHVVYEHTGPERFEQREVRIAPLDGERVLVLSGIETGRRVVTQGAELLDQVR
ncbi:MAG TPA: efflux RND transporter periplasmic adaptor subunit [Xanthobacteraceae bacterium]|nr:efflux RND transporter periplasmic adaptor subunit [Xanthobacteraceae bacterium]